MSQIIPFRNCSCHMGYQILLSWYVLIRTLGEWPERSIRIGHYRPLLYLMNIWWLDSELKWNIKINVKNILILNNKGSDKSIWSNSYEDSSMKNSFK